MRCRRFSTQQVHLDLAPPLFTTNQLSLPFPSLMPSLALSLALIPFVSLSHFLSPHLALPPLSPHSHSRPLSLSPHSLSLTLALSLSLSLSNLSLSLSLSLSAPLSLSLSRLNFIDASGVKWGESEFLRVPHCVCGLYCLARGMQSNDLPPPHREGHSFHLGL